MYNFISPQAQVGDTVQWAGSRYTYTISRIDGNTFYVEGFPAYPYSVSYIGDFIALTKKASAPVRLTPQASAPVRLTPQASAPVRLTPQANTVLTHIKRAGSITQREALVDHSVQSLTRRITEVRDAGFNIDREFRYHPITGQRYARYSLAST